MKLKLAVFLVLFAAMGGSAFGQGFRFDSTVTQQGTIGAVTNAVVIPAGSQIAFCGFPANAVPCTNKATTYTTNTLGTPCSTSTQIVLTNTTSCVVSPDSQGNWGVWAAQGQYAFTITLPGGINLGPYNLTLGIAVGTNLSLGSLTTTGPNTLGGGGSLAGTFSGNPTLSGNPTFSGNPIHNGIETFNTNAIVANAGITSAGPNSLSGGGSLGGTFSGNHTESGILTETNAINPCRLGNVRYIDTANTCGWSGTDFGGATGWIASAAADLPATGGKIKVSLGQYTSVATTAIQFATNNKGIQIECDNAGANISAPDAAATRLAWSSLATGFAIQFVNGAALGQGITGCDLVGPGTATTTGGVQVGGAGGSALTFGVWLLNSNITNFGTSGGVAMGNGAGFFRMDGGQAHDNGKNLLFPAGITSATEGFRFNNVLFQNKAPALYLNSVDVESPVNDLTFQECHFDQAQLVLNGGTGFNIGAYVEDAHIENPNGAIGAGDANALIRNVNNNTTITNAACIIDNAVAGNECISHTAGNMTVIGFGAQANAGTATNAISANCAGCGLNIYSTHYLNSFTNLLTTNASTPALFNGAFSIVDQQLSAAGCTTPAVAGNACVTPITFTLSPAMPSANYRVLCTASGTPTNIPGAPYLQGVPTTTSFTVNYIALSAAAASYPNVSCRATQN